MRRPYFNSTIGPNSCLRLNSCWNDRARCRPWVSWRHRPKELRIIKQKEETMSAKSDLISTSTTKTRIYVIHAEKPLQHNETKVNTPHQRIFTMQILHKKARNRKLDFQVNSLNIPHVLWESFNASGQNTVWRRSCVLLCCFWAFFFNPGAWCLS